MQMHTVFYKANPRNSEAVQQIIDEAYELLSDIGAVERLLAGRVTDFGRVVNDAGFDVALFVLLSEEEDYGRYMNNPAHLEFVRFVLRGYMLKGSTAADPEEEFINHILEGGEEREWVRNPAIPDSEVVWGGEVVYDVIIG